MNTKHIEIICKLGKLCEPDWGFQKKICEKVSLTKNWPVSDW